MAVQPPGPCHSTIAFLQLTSTCRHQITQSLDITKAQLTWHSGRVHPLHRNGVSASSVTVSRSTGVSSPGSLWKLSGAHSCSSACRKAPLPGAASTCASGGGRCAAAPAVACSVAAAAEGKLRAVLAEQTRQDLQGWLFTASLHGRELGSCGRGTAAVAHADSRSSWWPAPAGAASALMLINGDRKAQLSAGPEPTVREHPFSLAASYRWWPTLLLWL